MESETGMNDHVAYGAYEMTHPDTKSNRIVRSRSIARILSGGVICLVLSTWLCFQFDVGLTVAAFVYLMGILLLSLMNSLFCSAVFSVLAVGCLDFFFTSPLLSFRVAREQDVAGLIAFLATSVVVTSLVHRTRRLCEIHREQAQLLDLTHDGVIVRDMEDIITYWNNGAEALYGWKKEEALGKVAHAVLRTRFPMAPSELKETLFATGHWEGELINTRRDGSQAAVASRWALLRNEHGHPIATLETSTDITERKRNEEALEHVARLTTVGEFGASVAHELAQPLSAINTNGRVCLRWLDQGAPNMDEVHACVQHIVRDSERAKEVIRHLRMLAKRTPTEMARLEINEVINDVIPLVQREVLNHSVMLKTKVTPGLPAVLGDRGQLAQVMINLIMNGIQAMASVDDRTRELLVESRCGDGCVIAAVKDSGSGIGVDNVDRIFEPFFTTKADGMGVGLSICRSIAQAHGGQLHAMSNAGYGATFELSLPLIIENAREA
jgi:two-component system, LuxR family, sensor kinase FixL